MTQQEKVQELKNNPQQARMLNEVMKIVNGAIKAEMPVFLKLVQFDAMKELQKEAAKDTATGKPSFEGKLTKDLDQIIGQIGRDLEKQIIAKFESIK